MGVTVTAGRARARRRTLRAPPAARRIELPQILQIIVGVRDSRMAQLQMSPRRRWASAPTGAGVAAGCTRATAHIAVLVSTQCDRVGSQRRRHQRWKNDIYRGTSGAKQGYAHWRFFPGPATCTGNTTGKLTWWTSMSDFEYYTMSFVNGRQLGGALSWVATSDAPDCEKTTMNFVLKMRNCVFKMMNFAGRVHKKLHRELVSRLVEHAGD